MNVCHCMSGTDLLNLFQQRGLINDLVLKKDSSDALEPKI